MSSAAMLLGAAAVIAAVDMVLAASAVSERLHWAWLCRRTRREIRDDEGVHHD